MTGEHLVIKSFPKSVSLRLLIWTGCIDSGLNVYTLDSTKHRPFFTHHPTAKPPIIKQ